LRDEHNFKKKFGQNFITNIDVIFRTIDLLELKNEDKILEVGPGDGRFTEYILEIVKDLTLVEIDPELIDYLEYKFEQQLDQLKIHNEDILEFNLNKFLKESSLRPTAYSLKPKYKVFGALPYNISKKIIAKFLEAENKPSHMVFVIQKEVAEDYGASPRKATFLSNYAKIFADVEYVFSIDKQYFVPPPKVDGGVLLFKILEKPRVENTREFAKFLKNGFRTPRKKLKKTLNSIYKEVEWGSVIEKLGLGENTRAAELEFESWMELFRYIP